MTKYVVALCIFEIFLWKYLLLIFHNSILFNTFLKGKSVLLLIPIYYLENVWQLAPYSIKVWVGIKLICPFSAIIPVVNGCGNRSTRVKTTDLPWYANTYTREKTILNIIMTWFPSTSDESQNLWKMRLYKDIFESNVTYKAGLDAKGEPMATGQ